MTERMKSPEEEHTLRRLSRTVLHAAERGRKPLFDTLTAANAERIAALAKEKPVFFENQESAEQKILLDPEIAEILPPEFFENPTAWIEAQPNIERHHRKGEMPTGETIGELWGRSYDVSKVKQISLSHGDQEKKIVSKRIDQDQLEEIALARQAFEAGIPTPKVVGEVLDRGNTYAWFERIDGINFKSVLEKFSLDQDLRTPFTVWSEDDFRRDCEELSYYGFLTPETKKKLRELWLAHSKDILRQEITIALGVRSGNPIEVKRQAVLSSLELSRFPKEAINDALQFHGYSSLEHFLESLPLPTSMDSVPEKIRKLKYEQDILEAMDKKSEGEIAVFRNQWEAIVRNDLIGGIEEEKERLKKLCEDKGIEHKDFNERNLVVEWDFKKDRPLRRDGNHTKVFIIDWEPKPKSSSKKSPE